MRRMPTASVRVVVVDDEVEVRELLRIRLERTGHFDVVGEGADGREAIALCLEHQPHVVIVDASMPGMHGLAAVPAITTAAPSTAIVVYTAESGIATRNEAERVGAHAVVGKLDPFDRLVETVFRLVPDLAPPPLPAPAPDAGVDRLAALLREERASAPVPRAGARAGRTFPLLVLLVLLPGLAFVAWVLAAVFGLLAR